MRPPDLCLFLLLACARALAGAAFPFHRALVPDVTTPQLVAVDLGPEFWRQGRANLRILDDERRAIPHLIRNATAWTNRVETVPCPLLGMEIREEADNILVFDLRVKDDGPAPTILDIATPLKDFERRVRIEGLGDLEVSSLAEGLIYDYSRFADIRQTRVRLPAHDFRRLRVRIDGAIDETRSPFRQITVRDDGKGTFGRSESANVRDRPFRIDRIGLYAERISIVQNGEREQSYPAAEWKAHPVSGGMLRMDIVTPGLPLRGVGLLTTASNFSYRVTLDADAGGELRRIADSRLTRVSFGPSIEDRTILRFSEQRGDRFRLMIHVRDNPPLVPNGIRLFGPVPQAVFLAEPGAIYRLAFGGDAATPVYDDTILRKALAEGRAPVTVAAGPIESNPENPAGVSRTWALGRKGLFRASILLMVLALGYALVRAARHVGDPSEIP